MADFAVIFDMDGVLVDSVSPNWRAMNKVLGDSYGVHVADEEIGQYLGQTLRDQVPRLSEKYSIEIDYDTFLAATNKLKKELFASLPPKDGVVALLQELQKQHVPAGVGTSTSGEIATERLSKAGVLDYFQALITEEDVTKHKPDPEVYLKVAERLGAEPAHCVVIEDAPNGIEAAKWAGMRCVAVRTPYVSDAKLAMADLIVSSLADVDISQLRGL